MAVEVTLTGSGTIGAVEAGWSVTESATPVALGVTAGSVGSVNLSAAATIESVFAIDNGFELQDTNLGTFSGSVIGATVAGAKVTLAAKGQLGALVAPRTVLPMVETAVVREWGSAFDCEWVAFADDGSSFMVDEANSRVVKFDATGTVVSTFGSAGTGDGQFTSPAGIAIDSVGRVWVADSDRVQRFETSDGVTYTFAYKFGSSGSGNGQFNYPAGIAFSPTGDLYVVDRANYRVQKFTTADSGATYTYSLKWGSAGTGNGQFGLGMLGIDVDSTGAVYVADPALSGRVQKFTSSGTYSTQWLVPFVADIAVSAADDVYVSALGGLTLYDTSGNEVSEFVGTDAAPAIISGIAVNSGRNILGINKGTGSLVLLMGKSTLSTAFTYYIQTCVPGAELLWSAASDPEVVFPAWEGDVWTHLKQLCAVFDVELTYTGGKFVVRDIGSASVELVNKTVPSVYASNVFGGRQVSVVAQRPTAAAGVVLWSATDVLTVDVRQTWSITVATDDAYPTAVTAPQPYFQSAPFIDEETYRVVDSTGAFVSGFDWSAAGGFVEAAVVGVNLLRITVNGPADIAGYTAPFSFADSDGNPVFAVKGSAVVTSPVTVELLTGANETLTTRENAYTVDSPFVDTVERAYDRGVWASMEAAGPSITATFTVPSESLDGFGVTPGAVFTYTDNKWRVTDCTFGRVQTAITATRHVTLGDIDTVWAGGTLGDYDTFWSGYSFGDQTLKPLAS